MCDICACADVSVQKKSENLYKMQVSPGDILISPVQCKSLWRQFQGETEYTITQAIAAQVKSFDCVLTSGLLFPLSL